MRRHSETPVTFSKGETQRIRLALGGWPKDQQRPSCPLCEGKLEVNGPIEGTGSLGPVWRVDCFSCHRTAFITEVPHTRELDSSK
jgi:hypothetical protein